MFVVAKDFNRKTIYRGVVPHEVEAWECAKDFLLRNPDIVRVVFYTRQYEYVNGLSRATYDDSDILSEEDKQALRLLESL